MLDQNITNASKHWQIDYKCNLKGVSKPEIADWYSYFVAGPVIYVSLEDARPSIPEIACVTIECLQWILSGEESVFSEKLSEQLEIIFQPFK